MGTLMFLKFMKENGTQRRFAIGAGLLCALVVGLLITWRIRSGKETEPPAPLVEINRNLLILREGHLYPRDEKDAKSFYGLMIETGEGGWLKSRSVISNGVMEGVSEGWYTNGTKQVQEYFVGGISHGLRTKWYANGQKMSEAPILHGKLDGLYRKWSEDGKLTEQMDMKQGKADGLSLAYHPSGFLKARAEMKEGQIMKQEFWQDGEFKEPISSSPNASSDDR
jgi:hypothetical protein